MTPDDKPAGSTDPFDAMLKIGKVADETMTAVELQLCADSGCKDRIKALVAGIKYLTGVLAGMRAYNVVLLRVLVVANAVHVRCDADNLRALDQVIADVKKTAMRAAIIAAEKAQGMKEGQG